jgi:ribosomal protein L20
VRINAEARNNGLSYSRMIDGMNKAIYIIPHSVKRSYSITKVENNVEISNLMDSKGFRRV